MAKAREGSAKTAATERVVLVLQGGGALGAYQAGAFQRLSELGHQPDWVAGISIGAVNAAIICGNRPEERASALETFWHRITAALPQHPVAGFPPRQMFGDWAAAAVIAGGVPGFFSPRLPFAALMPGGLSHLTSFYDTAPLAETLRELVDFDYLNGHGPRLSVGAVDVETGNFVYFDSARERIGPEHILASGALPPGFPAVEVAGRRYWDGGLVSNTPLQHVMDEAETDPLCIFQVDLFSARGSRPGNMSDVQQREKDIRYSSRTRLTTDRYRELARLSQAAERLAAKLGEAYEDDEDLALLRAATPDCPIALVHLIHRDQAYEGASKDYEFSRLSMVEHWAAGERDVTRTLSHGHWKTREPAKPGLHVFDLTRDDHESAGGR
ncbi:patatin-like phospholipase family protein [Solirhodobacter olei]|uniref:patatin-like phospholipase family protein n=1 Tax=Solirhodobacter olei TaxID=2493082 RepID=UPI000FD700A5|nr:patatin-like phospholipase family protein [Solirhodobacter olei]